MLKNVLTLNVNYGFSYFARIKFFKKLNDKK